MINVVFEWDGSLRRRRENNVHDSDGTVASKSLTHRPPQKA